MSGRETLRHSRALCAAVALAATTFAGRAGADDPSAPAGDFSAGVFGEGHVVDGQANADPVTGAMRYTFAFETPAARGGPQPGLALRYDSSWRDREAGYGWGLDLPLIEFRLATFR